MDKKIMLTTFIAIVLAVLTAILILTQIKPLPSGGTGQSGSFGEQQPSQTEGQTNAAALNGSQLRERYLSSVQHCLSSQDPEACEAQQTPERNAYKAWCESQGGRFGRTGRMPLSNCNLPTTDGGRLCTDSSQCESMCLAELTDQQKRALESGLTVAGVTGKCAEWSIVVGCNSIVQDDTAVVICID